jgi:hypothetical protein
MQPGHSSASLVVLVVMAKIDQCGLCKNLAECLNTIFNGVLHADNQKFFENAVDVKICKPSTLWV